MPYRLTSGIAANRRNVGQSDNAACKSDACSERWRTIIGDPRHSDSDRRRRSALVGCHRGPPRPARHHSVFIRRRSRRDGCSACTADLRRVDHDATERRVPRSLTHHHTFRDGGHGARPSTKSKTRDVIVGHVFIHFRRAYSSRAVARVFKEFNCQRLSSG